VPSSAGAQAPIAFSSLQVQLWPEYDQPSMLVIYDFQLAPGTALPVGVTIKFPKDANLMAVAVQASDGSLMNADYLESSADGDWQSVVVQIQSPTVYRVEYYQPLQRTGDQRRFNYQWPGDYAVQDLGISVRLPADATAFTAQPALQSTQSGGGYSLLENRFGPLEDGRAFALQLEYARTSETLSASQQDLQPSQPLDSSTPGRVMLSNYLPYILGALGLVLIVGGIVYFWQAGRAKPAREKRHRGGTGPASDDASDIYCHQCGTRAHNGDRFCRVCGTRLRMPE